MPMRRLNPKLSRVHAWVSCGLNCFSTYDCIGVYLYRKQRVLPHLSRFFAIRTVWHKCNIQSFALGVRHVQVSAVMNSLVSRLWCCALQTGYKRCLTCAAAANTPTKVLSIFLHSS